MQTVDGIVSVSEIVVVAMVEVVIGAVVVVGDVFVVVVTDVVKAEKKMKILLKAYCKTYVGNQ